MIAILSMYVGYTGVVEMLRLRKVQCQQVKRFAVQEIQLSTGWLFLKCAKLM